LDIGYWILDIGYWISTLNYNVITNMRKEKSLLQCFVHELYQSILCLLQLSKHQKLRWQVAVSGLILCLIIWNIPLVLVWIYAQHYIPIFLNKIKMKSISTIPQNPELPFIGETLPFLIDRFSDFIRCLKHFELILVKCLNHRKKFIENKTSYLGNIFHTKLCLGRNYVKPAVPLVCIVESNLLYMRISSLKPIYYQGYFGSTCGFTQYIKQLSELIFDNPLYKADWEECIYPIFRRSLRSYIYETSFSFSDKCNE
jgi:hypothetical protein